MAHLSSPSGLVSDLYNAASNWLSDIKGGLAIATVFTYGIFGAMSGASAAGASVMSVQSGLSSINHPPGVHQLFSHAGAN